jgi:hypothetical protein
MDATTPEKKLDTPILWRAALLQLIAVAVLSIVLSLFLSHDFFVDWGWFVGPVSWMLCAAFTARMLRLPLVATLIGAALAGLPSILAIVVNLHWLGALFAVGLFAWWCARLPRDAALGG